jgi:adenine-specific DNA-methyltransferase
MVELGEHCHTHIVPRLKKVIDGADPGGITEATCWKGGGGFRYYRLAPSLLERDKLGQLGHQQGVQRRDAGRGAVQAGRLHLRPERFDLLAARAHRRSAISSTSPPQNLTDEQLTALSEEVGPERSLLVSVPGLPWASRSGTPT